MAEVTAQGFTIGEAPTRRGNGRSKYNWEAFFDAARANEGVWVSMVGPQSLAGYAKGIKDGQVGNAKPGEFSTTSSGLDSYPGEDGEPVLYPENHCGRDGEPTGKDGTPMPGVRLYIITPAEEEAAEEETPETSPFD